MGTCKMKSAQWRERKDGPLKCVGGPTGTGQDYENKMRFCIFGRTTKRFVFIIPHKTWVAKCLDSAVRRREKD